MLEKPLYYLLLFAARKDGIPYVELSEKLSLHFPNQDVKALIQQALDQAYLVSISPQLALEAAILVLCPLGRKRLEAYFDA